MCISYLSKNRNWEFGKSYKLFYFQVKESPCRLCPLLGLSLRKTAPRTISATTHPLSDPPPSSALPPCDAPSCDMMPGPIVSHQFVISVVMVFREVSKCCGACFHFYMHLQKQVVVFTKNHNTFTICSQYFDVFSLCVDHMLHSCAFLCIYTKCSQSVDNVLRTCLVGAHQNVCAHVIIFTCVRKKYWGAPLFLHVSANRTSLV